MVVTKIERLRSRAPRYRVRCDDGETIVLSEDLLVRLGLAAGDEISPQDFRQIRDAGEADDARQRAYQYISYRPRSEHEIIQYLRRKGFPDGRAEATVQDLRRLGLLDDAQYAAMVVRDAISRGRSGPAAVRKKLLEKRVARDIIDRLIGEHFTDEYLARQAAEILRKRMERAGRSRRKTDPVKQKARLYQYLCQRGFSPNTALQAIKEVEA